MISSESPFLSIIIPVYNVEKYLARCLDSILMQKVNFYYEIIAVNDSSTDSSREILLAYKNKYENLILIEHNCNKNLSVARNSGISICKGLYIMHIDSDDWIEKDSLQYIYNSISQTSCDVMVFNYFIENSKQERNLIKIIKEDKFVTDKRLVYNFFVGAPWNKIVKRSILSNLIYGQVGINNGEDLVYGTELLLKVDKIKMCEYSFYVYFNNLNSLTGANNSFSFLLNQYSVIVELSKIIKMYGAESSHINYVVNYFLEFIYLEIFKYNFKFSHDFKIQIKEILSLILTNELITVKDNDYLKRAINSKFYSFIEVLKRFGFKKTVGLIIN
jgi:glycosyltransferase involved in cell wall biosynthesis